MVADSGVLGRRALCPDATSAAVHRAAGVKAFVASRSIRLSFRPYNVSCTPNPQNGARECRTDGLVVAVS
jgi:hypothetical protein